MSVGVLYAVFAVMPIASSRSTPSVFAGGALLAWINLSTASFLSFGSAPRGSLCGRAKYESRSQQGAEMAPATR